MDADPLPDEEHAGVLVLHRPNMMTAGGIRRVHVFLDNEQVADLELGGTTRVPAAEGPHLLRARCLPLVSADFPFILGANETLQVHIYVGALDELEIHLEEDPGAVPPSA